MKHSESVAALVEALAAAQAEYVTVPKNKMAKVRTKAGGEYTYAYADLADILAMALPRLSKHGIAFSQPHILVDGKLRVVTHLLHKSGEWMQSDGIEISEDGDPQQFGAESTYFRRYDGASLLGIAPDEDTDAQQAGNRQRRTTNPPQSAPPQATGTRTSSPERPVTTQQSAQQAEQRAATAPAGAQPQGGALKFIPPNGLTCVIRKAYELSADKLAEIAKAKKRPWLTVEFLGSHNGVSEASCFDTKYWDLLKGSVGLECHFVIKERDNNDRHYINIDDVRFVDGVECQDGKPIEGAQQ